MEPSYVPNDLMEYEERAFMGLTGRQLKWGAVAMITGVSTYLFTMFIVHIPQDICMYITCAISFGLFWMGWRNWQNTRPYMDKVKAVLWMRTNKQRVFFTNINYLFREEEKRVQKRKDKKIDRIEGCEYARGKQKAKKRKIA